MVTTKRPVTGLTLSFALFAFANTALATDNGLVTEQSRYSVKETVARFELAVKAKELLGFMVFTEIHPRGCREEIWPRDEAAHGHCVR